MRSAHLLSSVVLVSVVLVACGATGQTLQVGGHARSFLLHVSTTAASGKYPLVIALHGGGGTAAYMAKQSRFAELADREGFAVVFPESFNGYWNDGRVGSGAEMDIDDVGYLRALIDHLVATYPIDQDRVFATGMSNGGIMSYRLACELSDKIAAIAPVAGGMNAALAPRCHPARPISLLAINGTADPFVPWQGGQVHVFRDHGAVLGASDSAALVAGANRCTAVPTTRWEPDRDPNDGTRVQAVDYAECAEHAAVELLNINGGGHTWPGGQPYLPVALVGRLSHEFGASERIWRFFTEHARR